MILQLTECGINGKINSLLADMAELADAPDLGSGIYDVQVQVLLSALKNGRMRQNSAFPAVLFCPLILK